MLRGSDLLSKVKELGPIPKSEVVRACGYVSPRKDGSQRLNYTAFYEALLEAKGMSFGGAAGESASRRDSVGRKLSYIAKVHFNGNLLVGKAYTSVLGLKPGDEFDIKLERKGIRLIPKHRSEGMMPDTSASGPGEESEAQDIPSASAPLPEPETPPISVATPEVPVAPPSAPPVAPAPIPPVAPVAAPAAPPAPGLSPAPAAPVAAAPAPRNPTGTVAQQPAPKPSPQTSAMDSWEDSLRKLDQSSRPERWDA